jgi:hypothetical protein
MLNWLKNRFFAEKKDIHVKKKRALTETDEIRKEKAAANRGKTKSNILAKSAKKSEVIKKSFGNAQTFTKQAKSMDSASVSSEAEIADEFYGWLENNRDESAYALSLFARDPIVAAVITKQAGDSVRNGFFVNGLDEGVVKKIDAEFPLVKKLKKAITLSLTHGGCAAFFEEKNKDNDVGLPINAQTFGRNGENYAGFYIASILEAMPQFEATRRENVQQWFFEEQQYHPSRVIPFVIDQRADGRILNNSFVGYSLAQAVINASYQWAQGRQLLLEQLRRKGSLNMQIESREFWDAFAGHTDQGESVDDFIENMANRVSMGSSGGNVFITPTGSTVESIQSSLGDSVSAIQVFKDYVAATAKMPATEIFGDAVNGLNASGEGSRKSYNQRLSDIQNELSDILLKHYTYSSGQDGLSIEWNPLDEPTTKEIWETNVAKSTVVSNLRMSGAINGIDARKWIREDQTMGMGELEDLTVFEQPVE